jgi:hypothetical protein
VIYEGPTRTRHMLALVLLDLPGGINSTACAVACRTSQPTASHILAGLWWRGLIDRHLEGRSYCYTPRLAVPPR